MCVRHDIVVNYVFFRPKLPNIINICSSLQLFSIVFQAAKAKEAQQTMELLDKSLHDLACESH